MPMRDNVSSSCVSLHIESLRIESDDAVILKSFLNNYNLTTYAITKNNVVNDADIGKNSPRFSRLFARAA
ncbi:hypothetical protein Pcaca04_17350 [Pectobacterium carotovorum subsp. carotovorum]|nr:hypothetical protein Pcaca04_17350 [Pectobacterium carotovorum subsp. carotovorum]